MLPTPRAPRPCAFVATQPSQSTCERRRLPCHAERAPAGDACAQVQHDNQGAGQTGAIRLRELMPHLRWQNPDALIESRQVRAKGATEPRVLLELADGETREMNVRGRRTEDILGEVLHLGGAPEETIASTTSWAAQVLAANRRKKPAGTAEQAEAGDEPDSSAVVGEETAAAAAEQLER